MGSFSSSVSDIILHYNGHSFVITDVEESGVSFERHKFVNWDFTDEKDEEWVSDELDQFLEEYN